MTYNTLFCKYEKANETIRSLQQEVSQLKEEQAELYKTLSAYDDALDRLSANPGALSQDKGEGVQAEWAEAKPIAEFDLDAYWKDTDKYTGVKDGDCVLLYGRHDARSDRGPGGKNMGWHQGFPTGAKNSWDCLSGHSLVSVTHFRLLPPAPSPASPSSPSPLEGIEPPVIAEISNLAKPGSQSTDNGEGEA